MASFGASFPTACSDLKRMDRGCVMEKTRSKKIFVTIQEGGGEVCEDTVPDGFEVEILNFDLLAKNPAAEMPWWSSELRDYSLKNHKSWDRCEPDCPCQRLLSFERKREG